MGTILDAALEYSRKKYSVIPVGQDKRPFVKWEPYQSKRASEEEIKAWWKKYPSANVAIVTGEISNLLVVDTDTAAAIMTVNDAIPDSLSVPCQRTPKGGKHFLFAHYPGLVNRARVADGIDIRTSGGYVVASPSVNGNGRGWEWLEDLSPMQVDPPEVPQSVLSIINNALSIYSLYRESSKDCRQVSTLSSNVVKLFSEGRRDEDLFTVANGMVKGGVLKEYIHETLRRVIFSWGEQDEQWIATKIESALKRAERRDRNLAEEVHEWILSSSGVFLSSEVVKCLHLSSREEEKNLSKILKRESDQGFIEKHGERRGSFRVKDNDLTEIDWESCDDTVIDVRWPFELESLYLCLPKNIIIVAGSPDAGKTAFCLNFAIMNSDRGIKYFSSEMGALELKTRLKKSAIPFQKWKKIKFVERSHNFADVIDPDGINIVDYIEVPEEAWKIATPINEIFRKLNNGICLITLQKPRGRDIARGGESTLDRPRLYLSMGDGKLKIMKCKNWAQDDVNPNGLSIEYKVIQGFGFIKNSEWGIPWDETSDNKRR